MSKNITIQEGGSAKQLTVDKLKTRLVGGGSCLWVPEDSVRLGAKTITEDGTYKASDEELYGYNQVTVHGLGTASGTIPKGTTITGDGNEYAVNTDQSGNLKFAEMPSSIKIAAPPTATDYIDGIAIDFTGLVVRAYTRDGELWADDTHPDGVIPLSELTLPVTAADAESSHREYWTDGQGVNAVLISYTLYWGKDGLGRDFAKYVSQVVGMDHGRPATYGGDGPTQFFATIYDGKFYIWGSTANRALNRYMYYAEREVNKYEMYSGTSERTGTGELVILTLPAFEEITNIPTSTAQPTGNTELSPVDACQSIPVQWNRPYDGATLETSFEINVK